MITFRFIMPTYQAFVDECHRSLNDMFFNLCMLLSETEATRIMDSTMLPVCKLHRADHYKVAKDKAKIGKNGRAGIMDSNSTRVFHSMENSAVLHLPEQMCTMHKWNTCS